MKNLIRKLWRHKENFSAIMPFAVLAAILLSGQLLRTATADVSRNYYQISPLPTFTFTPSPAAPTNTPPPPTATDTATPTQIPPTSTDTATPTQIPPTSTDTATPTQIPPTSTDTATPTQIPPTATDTATPTQIPPTATVSAVYDFSGFFRPVDNPPTVNLVKAGRAIPVKFSLNGDQGLDIFAEGYPVSRYVACDGGAPMDGVEVTMTAGGSSLSYDPVEDQYNYVWKTKKAWNGTCRRLTVRLDDGSEHVANFEFK